MTTTIEMEPCGLATALPPHPEMVIGERDVMEMVEDTFAFVPPGPIGFAGDWHTSPWALYAPIKYMADRGVKVVIHVGDLNVRGPYHEDWLNRLNEVLTTNGMVLMFVDGNHEDFGVLHSYPVNRLGVRVLRHRVWHLPRGFRWNWWGVEFLALGGAYSINRDDGDWDHEELIGLDEAGKIISDKKDNAQVDVMITHDCPDLVDIPKMDSNSPWPASHLAGAAAHRGLMGRIVDELTPNHLIHGHYHTRYDQTRRNRDDSFTGIHGLDKEGSVDKNIVIVNDVAELGIPLISGDPVDISN